MYHMGSQREICDSRSVMTLGTFAVTTTLKTARRGPKSGNGGETQHAQLLPFEFIRVPMCESSTYPYDVIVNLTVNALL